MTCCEAAVAGLAGFADVSGVGGPAVDPEHVLVGDHRRVETGERSIDDGEIDIDARFDELGGDDASGLAVEETLPDFCEDEAAVLWAHEGR